MLLAKRNQIIGLLLLIVMILVSTQSAFAVGRKNKKSHRHKDNAPVSTWSIQLSLENEYDNDEFDGVRFSLQKMTSRNSAVKFSLGVLDNINDPFHNVALYSDGITLDYYGWDDKAEEVNLSIQFIHYPDFNRSFNLYWGIGPRLSVVEADYDPDVYVDVPSRMEWVDYADFESSNRIGLGIEGNIGAELFLGNSVSLFAEYGFIAENRWYIIDVDYYNNSGYHDHVVEKFDDGTHTDWSKFRLGVAMHF